MIHNHHNSFGRLELARALDQSTTQRKNAKILLFYSPPQPHDTINDEHANQLDPASQQ